MILSLETESRPPPKRESGTWYYHRRLFGSYHSAGSLRLSLWLALRSDKRSRAISFRSRSLHRLWLDDQSGPSSRTSLTVRCPATSAGSLGPAAQVKSLY